MSHRSCTPRRLSLLALALILSACSPAVTASPSASPSPSPQASASPSAAASAAGSASPSSGGADIATLTAQISAEVSALRDLAFERPVQPEIVTEQQASDLIAADFHADNSDAFIAAEQGLYRRLGLLAPDASLATLYQQLIDSQVLGFYQEKVKKLYVVARSGGVGPTERYTMAHELTHALQDQHFDLQKVSPDLPGQSDRMLAAHAVMEGDASLVGTLWMSQHLTAQDIVAIVAAGADPTSNAALARTPAIIKDPEMFLYGQGLQFVLGLRQQGGWGAVDAALQSPPASTEQVIHPEKYAAHEAPVAVSLPAGLAAKVGAGWTLALEDTFGELELRIWLESSKSSAALATNAAAGWGGDRIGYLTGPDGQDAAIMWTAWDTKADADQFVDAAGRLAADGASPGTVIRASDREVVVIIASQSLLLDEVARAAGFPIPR